MLDLENPATLLYLNPVLQATNLAITVEDVITLCNRDPSIRSLPSNLPILQNDVTPLVYLSQNKDVIDVSSTNRMIFLAMSNVGRDVTTTRKNASFHGTILRPATLTAVNTFVFKDPRYKISSRILQVGDEVKISANENDYQIVGFVTSIREDKRGFMIDTPSHSQCYDTTDDYVVYGIRLYDMERLANSSLANTLLERPDYKVLSVEKEFDVDLYHLLYPDTRLMCLSEAYIDYVNNWGAGSYRITKASDLQNIRAPGIEYKELDVSNTFTVGDKSFVVQTSGCACDLNETATATLKGTYIGQALNIDHSNLVANDSSVSVRGSFSVGSNALNVTSNAMSIGVNAMYSCNVCVDGSLEASCTVYGERLIAWSAIGIGALGGISTGVLNDVDMACIPHTTNPSMNVAVQVPVGSDSSPSMGQWKFEESTQGSLTLKHPLLEPKIHVFDTSGHVGFNLKPDSISQPLKYGIVLDGDIFTTGSVISQSDSRVKKNLKTIGGALDRLSLLTGYTYASKNHQICTGLLAQDVRGVLPEAVHEDDEGLLSIAYGNLAGLFVEAIKELKREVMEIRFNLEERTQLHAGVFQ